MRRLGGKGTDIVTLVHKLVGVVWIVSAIVVLWLVVPALSAGETGWGRVATAVRISSMASVATLIIALVYALATPWGFLGSRWLGAKWLIYLGAVSASGYAIRASREQNVGTTVLLASVQLVLLVAAVAIGVHLERSRHAGRSLGS